MTHDSVGRATAGESGVKTGFDMMGGYHTRLHQLIAILTRQLASLTFSEIPKGKVHTDPIHISKTVIVAMRRPPSRGVRMR